jgi:hypothetical protein
MSERRQHVFDLRRSGVANGAFDHTVPFQRLERPRQHLLRNPAHTPLDSVEAL